MLEIITAPHIRFDEGLEKIDELTSLLPDTGPVYLYRGVNYSIRGSEFINLDTGETIAINCSYYARHWNTGVLLYENGDSADILTPQGVVCFGKDSYMKKIPLEVPSGSYVYLVNWEDIKHLRSEAMLWSDEKSPCEARLKKLKGKPVRVEFTNPDYGVTSDFFNRFSVPAIFIKSIVSGAELAKIQKKEAMARIKTIFEESYRVKEIISEKTMREQLRAYFDSYRKNDFLLVEKEKKQKTFFKDFYSQIEFAKQKIKDHKKIESVVFDDRNLDFTIVTKPLFIEYSTDRSEYIGLFAGKFKIVINLVKNEVQVYNAGDYSWNAHPHVGSSGAPCWGNLGPGMIEAMKTGDYYGVFVYAIELLQGLSGSTYYSIVSRNSHYKGKMDKLLKAEKIKYDFSIEKELSDDDDGDDDDGDDN